MDLEKALRKCLGWDSPIGVGIFLIGLGMFFYLGALALKIIVSL